MGNLWKVSLLLAAIAVYWIGSSDHFDPKTLAGKRVLITGASSGIGEHLAYEYSKLGARVVIAARRGDRLKKVAQKCLELGAAQAETTVSDMAKVEDRDWLVKEVESRLGGLDVLILNHAILKAGWWQWINDTDVFLNHVEVNFVSFVDLTAKALPMLTASNGSIAVVSSMAGVIPFPGFTIYGSTKFALQGFFHSLRQELPLRNIGVSVTLAVIGLVDTDIVVKTEEKKQKMRDVLGPFLMYMMETPQDTALAIVKGVTTQQTEIYFGKVVYYSVLFHNICPFLIERVSMHFGASFPYFL